MATAPATQPLMNFIGTGSTNKMFDVTHERKRRNQLDRMWKRSKDEEEEEMELRKELREVEAQLRKLKKSGGHILAAAGIRGTPAGGGSAGGNVTGLGGGTANPPPSASSSRNPSRSVSPMPGGGTGAFFSSKLNSTDGTTEVGHDVLDKIFASTAPVPMPGYPYLQSGRLVPPAAGGDAGINKSLLTQMDQVLNELNIKDRPLPTKQVCDTYDSVRKDILTLLTLQKIVMQKEGQLQAKQVQLAKLTKAAQPPSTATSTTGEAGTNNTDLLDEEGLLGIPPPDQAPAPTTAKTQKSKPVKKKAPAAGTIGNAAVGSSKKGTKKTPDDANAAAGNKSGEGATATKKKPVKRKRKSEAKTQPPPGGPTPSVAKSAGQGKKSSVSTPIASDPIALAAQAAAAAASAVAGLDVAKAADIAVSAATTPSSGNAKKRARKS
jgi:DNA methyltransferase 1-associated protein 1